MLVDKATHKFNNDLHTMDLTLVGGEFVSTLASSSSYNNSSNKNNNSSNTSSNKGKEVTALFTAYYPANNSLQGGLYDAMGNKLNPNNKTCAAPKSIPFGTKIKIQGTGTSRDGEIYTVTDRGGAITIKNGVYHFDILMNNKTEAYGWGRKNGKALIIDESSSNTSSSTSSDKSSKLISVAKSKLGCKYVWEQQGLIHLIALGLHNGVISK